MLSTRQDAYLPMVGGAIEGGSFTTLLQPGMLGQLTEVNVGTDSAPLWVTYRLVKLKASLTYTVGEIVYWDDRDDYIVTNVDDSAGNLVAGFIPAGGTPASAPSYTFTAGQYCFIVVRGRRCVKGLDSGMAVAPDTLGKAIVPSTTNSRVDCVTTATMNAIVGRSCSAQDSTTKLFLCDVMIPDVA